MPASALAIGGGVFYGCSGLTSVTAGCTEAYGACEPWSKFNTIVDDADKGSGQVVIVPFYGG